MEHDDINDRIEAGRKTIGIAQEPGLDVGETEPQGIPPAVVAAGIGVALVGVGLLGWLFYRSRRRRTLIEQLRTSFPDRVRDARQLSQELYGSLPDRMRDARSMGDDLITRLRKAV